MHADVVIVGAGLAGLSTALALDGRSVLLVNDTAPASEVASAWAQGGVAAALAPDDTPALHEADTLAAAAGLADPATVHALAEEAPDVVALLARLGVPFDRDDDGALALGLEAAHSRRRIAHAADRTGAAIVRALLAVVAMRPEIRLVTGWHARDLIVRDGRVGGVVFADARGRTHVVSAGAVVLASGGFGGLYARTTTPRATLGSGIVMAARAGATLVDLEFVQFHPTALRVAADPLPLVSEAVRGEGAVLVNGSGNRFVDELAPRDVVARAIAAVEAAGDSVALDARAALGTSFAMHFPGIAAACAVHGIDPATMPIPVTPAAHYTIGGIATDARGRASVPGLWACGEVAATGLHGANRLASNSLMEAAVFGARVARDIAGTRVPRALASVATVPDVAFAADVAAEIAPLRIAMSAYAGVVRDAAGLGTLLAECDRLEPVVHDPRARDAVTLARFVARAALARRESRGAHARRDYPAADPRFAARAFVGAADLARSS
jgi:L-aspartate oxidase